MPEIDGNPLTAHLPLGPDSDDEAFVSLALKPQFNIAERELPRAVRRLMVKRLRRFFLPFMREHRRALTGICTNVFEGYAQRNPMTPVGQRLLSGQQLALQTPPGISLLTGCSGMGKSTLISQVLRYLGPQVCVHTSFQEQPFTEAQVLYLRRNVPERCTVPTLCDSFGGYADEVLGQKMYANVFARIRSGKGHNAYLRELRKIVSTHHVGILVLDELQNLSLIGVGAKVILAFLVNLRDELGVPIVGIGTYKALKLVESDESAGRRFVEGGYFDLQRPTSADSQDWDDLCSPAWEYQWVRNPAPYSENIAAALYEVSQGIPAIMLSAFASAQITAIDEETERVDADLIRRVFKEQMGPLHPAVRALQSGDPTLMDKFEGLYANHWPAIDQGDCADATIPPTEGAGSYEGASKESVGGNQKRTQRQSASQGPTRTVPTLTAEQMKSMVTAKSTQDLLSILDRR